MKYYYDGGRPAPHTFQPRSPKPVGAAPALDFNVREYLEGPNENAWTGFVGDRSNDPDDPDYVFGPSRNGRT